MTAETEVSFLREALREAQAAQTTAQRELGEARAQLQRLTVVEAEVERLRSELEVARAEGQASDSLGAGSKDQVKEFKPVAGPELRHARWWSRLWEWFVTRPIY